METRSTHLLVELWEANREKLNSVTAVREILQESARRARVTLLHSAFHKFSPVGVSGVVVIAESHISIHTWPESGYAAADIFTCGNEAMPEIAVQYMAQAFEAQRVEVDKVIRGVPRNEVTRPRALVPQPMNVVVA